jgi:DNA-binding CsgD family transcriptional regulator
MRGEQPSAEMAEQVLDHASRDLMPRQPAQSGKPTGGPLPRERLRLPPRSPAVRPPTPAVAPLGAARPVAASAATAASFLSTDLPVPSEARLRELFELTPAEARLAQGLARGDALEEVADLLQIKMSTARSQLAAIFSKTRTRRQAGLVAILSRVAHLDE